MNTIICFHTPFIGECFNYEAHSMRQTVQRWHNMPLDITALPRFAIRQDNATFVVFLDEDDWVAKPQVLLKTIQENELPSFQGATSVSELGIKIRNWLLIRVKRAHPFDISPDRPRKCWFIEPKNPQNQKV